MHAMLPVKWRAVTPATVRSRGRVEAADDAEHQNGDEYQGCIGLAFAKAEQITKPHIAADQFTDHHADDGQRGADAQSGEQGWQRARKFDLAEDLRPRRLESTREIDEIGIDATDRGQHVDRDGEEDDEDGDQDLRVDGKSHPENEKRGERHFRRDLQRQDVRRQRQLRRRRHAESVADEPAEHAAEREAGEHLACRDQRVQQQMVRLPRVTEFDCDGRQWRHHEGRNTEKAGPPLPRDSDDDEQCEARDHRAARGGWPAGAHHAPRAAACGSATACPTPSRSISRSV